MIARVGRGHYWHIPVNAHPIYTTWNQYLRGIVDYEQAIRLERNYAQAYCNRGAVYSDLASTRRSNQPGTSPVLRTASIAGESSGENSREGEALGYVSFDRTMEGV